MFASLLAYNFKGFLKKHDKLADEFSALKDDYHRTREQIVKLESEAVTRGELKDMFKEFEIRLESKFDNLDNKMNSNLNSLKEILTERFKNTPSSHQVRRWEDNIN